MATLRAAGWRPTPLRQFVLKVHQRCNLACDYCYVYTQADQSWRSRPVVMSPEIWQAAAARIAQHVRTHRLTDISLVLHGGEPLLAGAKRLTAIAQAVRSAVGSATAVRIGLQTNGMLLTRPMLSSLAELDIRIGVSLDGSAVDNDVHRRTPGGRGSATQVEKNLRLLSTEFRSAFSGLLCTIDPATDPVGTYEALLAFAPPSIDVLMPHTNWSVAGPAVGTPLADWLIPMFDRWFDAEEQETVVRLFDSIIRLTLGGAGRSEFVGLAASVVVVVETDGAIEQTDSLKSTYPHAADTGLSVFSDDFDAVLEHPGMIARQIGLSALSETCQECDLRRVCGGGHYVHRYRAGSGFRNPSFYCADLKKLIRHVHARVAAEMHRRTHEITISDHSEVAIRR